MTRGAALPSVLLLMAIGSALVVGGAYVSRRMADSSATSKRGLALEPAAEAAIISVLADWDSASRAAQPVGATSGILPVTITDAQTNVWLTRLSVRTWWVVAEAEASGKPMLVRRLAALVDWLPGTSPRVPVRGWAELPY